jgi:hypothetical protein
MTPIHFRPRRIRRWCRCRERPPQAAAWQLGPRLRGLAGVLAPHMTTADAPQPANRDQQHRGAPPERLVSQPTRERVPGYAFAPTPPTPIIGLGDPAGQDRDPARRGARRFQAELLQTAEGQVRAGEGSVSHVEVFPMDSVRTPIIRRLRPLPGQRPARPTAPSFAKSPLTGSSYFRWGW